jgi:hypothetical protein
VPFETGDVWEHFLSALYPDHFFATDRLRGDGGLLANFLGSDDASEHREQLETGIFRMDCRQRGRVTARGLDFSADAFFGSPLGPGPTGALLGCSWARSPRCYEAWLRTSCVVVVCPSTG